jgi:predicted ATPase/DNA-binding XRE family transcriptional regulator
MESTPEFGPWLRRSRVALDLTQEALAEAVGCAAETVRSFEAGRRRPSREMAARIAEVLQLPAPQRELFVQVARSPAPPRPGEPPPAVVRPPAPRLPAEPLIGRQDELARLRRALIEEGRRLVTVLGPGGIGKTRLAMQSAADLGPAFADGAVFVALASVADADAAVLAIAEAIALPLSSAKTPRVALLEALREREQLLALDNLEHLLGPGDDDRLAALLGEILTSAPGVRLLATSRERLRLRGELVVELAGLDLPDERPNSRVERSAAAMLFLERARQVAGDFALTSENRGAVAQICRLLGGVPLAIELAASWARALTSEEIAAELARGLDLPARSDRDLPPRHRSLRAVLDHSWELLTPAERDLLASLSVFHGGCRREALAAVLPPDEARAALPTLASLVDKSLVRRTADADGATRYDLHEFVRQYAATRLDERPEAARSAAARHAAYYGRWVADQEPVLKSARQRAALTTIGAEIANVRAAWRRACADGDAELLRQMIPTLDWFFEIRSWNPEAVALFGLAEQALRPLVEGDAPVATRVCYWLVYGREGFHKLRRDPAFAVRRLHESVVELRRLSHGEQLHCIKGLAYVKMFGGDYEGARALLDEAVAVAVAAGDSWNEAMSLTIRGVLEALRNNVAEARRQLGEAVAKTRAVGDPRPIALGLTYVGTFALEAGDTAEAERLCREALVLAAEGQDRFQMCMALQALGRVALARDDLAEAAWLFDEGLNLAREIGDRWMEARARGCLGALAERRGELARARAHRRAAVAAAMDAPAPFALDELLELARLELAVAPDPALTALVYVCRHPLTAPAARVAAEAAWSAAAAAAHDPARVAAAEAAAAALPTERPASVGGLFGAG